MPTSKVTLSPQELGIIDNSIVLNVTNRRLSDVLLSIQRESGVHFILAAALKDEKLTFQSTASSWKELIHSALRHFNITGFINKDGGMMKVLVSGKMGNGTESVIPITQPDLLSYQENPFNPVMTRIKRPDHLAHLAPAAIHPIHLNRDALFKLKPGEQISLDLPSGQYHVIHDNRMSHENGDTTWIGYLQGFDKQSRVILTFDKAGAVGRISTPEAIYRVESGNASQWLIDINSAGLVPLPLNRDGKSLPISQTGAHNTSNDAVDGMAEFHDFVLQKNIIEPRLFNKQNPVEAMFDTMELVQQDTTENLLSSSANIEVASAADITTIDVMILYTPGMDSLPSKDARINNLIAISNQAYIDSKALLKIRLVYAGLVNYTDNNLNDTALYDLTDGIDQFSNIPALRQEYGADLVSLLRPFHATTQKNCGIAWVGAARGRSFSAQLGFSVVSDGVDGFYYCTDYTFAHELGHNMGSVHDRANSSFQGRFPYSYGYGVQGQFGTIMSYLNPELGLFSNPDIDCIGWPCGVHELADDAANITLSLNNSVTFISDFMQTVIPEPTPTPPPSEPPPITPPQPDPGPDTGNPDLGYDLNSNAVSDIAWVKGKQAKLWLMNRDSTPVIKDIQPPAKNYRLKLVADFNNDGHPDLFWRNSKGRNMISLMNDDSNIDVLSSIPKASNAWKIQFKGDFNNDKKQDIVWRHNRSGKNVIWLMDGTHQLSANRISRISSKWKIVSVADFNQDGFSDLVWRNKRKGIIQVDLMNGMEKTTTIKLPDMNAHWRIVANGDFNGDGEIDLLMRHRKHGTLLIWFLKNGQWDGEQLLGTEKNRRWRIKGTGDFNGDATSDILWQHRNGDGQIMIIDNDLIKRQQPVPAMKKWRPLIH